MHTVLPSKTVSMILDNNTCIAQVNKTEDEQSEEIKEERNGKTYLMTNGKGV